MNTPTILKIHKRSPETLAAMQGKIAELARQRDVMVAYVEKDAAIEHRELAGGEWCASAIPQFNWQHYDYRVKPEPVELEVWYNPTPPAGFRVGYADAAPETVYLRGEGYTKIKMRQVLD